MAQVKVTIAGRDYRMACGDGEEPHLEDLARQVDEKIQELRAAFGEIGDQRLVVMAAVTFADELSEMRRKLARLETERDALRAAHAQTQDAQAGLAASAAEAVEAATARVERLTRALNEAE